MGWIDTHCHLNDIGYQEDLEEVWKRAIEAGVEHMIVIGYDLPSSEKAVAVTKQYSNLSAAVGVHPSDADTYDVYTEENLAKLLMEQSVVALGEIGLDYYWEDNPPKEVQKEVFRRQLDLAMKADKPVIIHMREATKDTYDILKEYPGIRGVMHCYSGSYEMAMEFIKLGFYISLGGPVTFKNAVAPKEVAEKIPLKWLLIETDCPYLTPHPFRGKRNEPAYVTLVGKQIAALRGMPEEELQKALKENATSLFGV